MDWFDRIYESIRQLYGHPGYLDNITAGLHVMVLEVVLVTVLLSRFLQHLDKKHTEKKWRDTRKQLATALLVSGVQLGKSTERLFAQSSEGAILLNSDFKEQLSQISTAIDNVNDQVMFHLNALTPALVQDLSILSAKLSGYQHTISFLMSLAPRVDICPYASETKDGSHIFGEALLNSPERWDALAQNDWNELTKTYFAKMCMYAIRHGHDIASYLLKHVDKFHDAKDLPDRWELTASHWRNRLKDENNALIFQEAKMKEDGVILMTVNRPFWK